MHDVAIRYLRYLQAGYHHSAFHSALSDLSKTALPYVKTDLSQLAWEGDESDDVEEDCSTNIINVSSPSVGTESGGLLQVFFLRINFTIYAFANRNKSQMNAQPRLASQCQQPHKSCGRSKVLQLKG
jgi:hypothetical protein